MYELLKHHLKVKVPSRIVLSNLFYVGKNCVRPVHRKSLMLIT